MNWSEIKYFKPIEWGPLPDKVQPKLIYLLDAIREAYGKSITIHCSYATNGHSKKSWHYKGCAVDFHFNDEDYAAQFDCIRSFDDVGGIGAYMQWNHPGFHIDIRPERLYWTERNGLYIYDLSAVLEDVRGS